MANIRIKNKLEVKPGNVISVPGCEPVSSLTGTGLLRQRDCNASIIPLEDALRLIPGSRVVRTLLPRGQASTGIFFELPDGPPPDVNDCDCTLEDYYKILRENATVGDQEQDEALELAGDVCSGFNFSGEVLDKDPLRTARDPNMRPNSNPLGGSSRTGEVPSTEPLIPGVF